MDGFVFSKKLELPKGEKVKTSQNQFLTQFSVPNSKNFDLCFCTEKSNKIVTFQGQKTAF